MLLWIIFDVLVKFVSNKFSGSRLLSIIACSRLSVSGDDRKREQALSFFFPDPTRCSLAITIVPSDEAPGTGYVDRCIEERILPSNVVANVHKLG